MTFAIGLSIGIGIGIGLTMVACALGSHLSEMSSGMSPEFREALRDTHYGPCKCGEELDEHA